MKARIIKVHQIPAYLAAMKRERPAQQPSCPNNEVKQWITQRNLTKLTPQTARKTFAALFAPVNE